MENVDNNTFYGLEANIMKASGGYLVTVAFKEDLISNAHKRVYTYVNINDALAKVGEIMRKYDICSMESILERGL